jgi:hypothetical protein
LATGLELFDRTTVSLREQSYAEKSDPRSCGRSRRCDLDPDSGEAHAVMSYLLTLLGWSRISAQRLRDYCRARRHMREALKVGVAGYV